MNTSQPVETVVCFSNTGMWKKNENNLNKTAELKQNMNPAFYYGIMLV